MLKTIADTGGSFWLPPQASSYAGDVDWLFWFIMAICVIFFLLVAVLVTYFAWKYRYQEGKEMEDAPKHNTALELTWTFVPTVLVVIIFVFGFKGYLRMSLPPPNVYEVVVFGKMWNWQFQYPNGHVEGAKGPDKPAELHVPQGVPVQYVLSSDDVIHGFYIPSFRVKKDVVPGRYNKIWAQGSDLGEYDIYCTQYCGDQHSQMRAKLIVQTPAEFNAWLADATLHDLPSDPVEHGRLLYQRNCAQCHTIDGKPGIGPTWKNLYGHTVDFADGTSTTADENYIRSMIEVPNNKIVKGFAPVMPLQTELKAKTHDVDHLIDFIKTQSDMFKPSAAVPTTKP